MYYKSPVGELQLIYGVEPTPAGARKAASEIDVEQVNLVGYPNPMESQVTIKSGESVEPIEVTFYSADGRIKHQVKTRFNTPIPVNHLMPGLYLLKVQDKHEVRYLKAVK